MNIERNFEVTLWRHRWRHHHKKNFFGIIWDDLFICEVRLKLCLLFQNFQNDGHFELATNFFYRKLYRKLDIPERYPWAFATFWASDRRSSSDIDGDISISKFDLFCDLVMSSMTSWIHIYIIVIIISWYLCTGSLMMISLLVFLVVMKNVVISFIKEYRGPTLRPPCDVIDQYFFGIIWDDLFVSELILKLSLIFKKIQNGRHFELATFIFNRSDTGSWIYQKDSH